jgi:hypothetical protein
MKKVILMAAASLAFIATSFAQNAAAPAKQKMVKSKPAMEAPAQGVPASVPAPTQGAPAQMENGKGHGKGHGEGKGEARGKSEGKGQNGMSALGLTPEQETQFKAINKSHKDAVKVVQMNESLAADAKKAQVAALVSKYQSDVQGVMNADQFAKWTAMRAKRSEGKGDGNRKEEDDNDGDHKNGGDHKKGNHKADGAAPATPTDGTMAPAEAPTMKVKKNKKSN